MISSLVDISLKMVRYNLRIVFGNKFVYFLLGATVFFIFVALINILDDGSPRESTLYYLLLFPGILLVFYPSVFGIQNDEDARVLEVLFGIPNYRYKVWLVRLVLMLIITYFMLTALSYLGSLSIYPTNMFEMAAQLMFPVTFLGCLAFMFSTMTRSGNGTAALMVVTGLIFWISAGILEENAWNIFLNPFEAPADNMTEVVWERMLFENRVYLGVGSILAVLYGLVKLQKRERFV